MVHFTTTPHPTIHNSCYITGECEHGQIQPLIVSSFLEYLYKQCEREEWVYQHITFGDHPQAIVISLQRGDLRAVCDESFDDDYGSAVFCIDGDGSIICGVNC